MHVTPTDNHKHSLPSLIARVLAAIMLVWALDRHPYDYYTLLRWITCGVSAYMAWYSAELAKDGWVWIFGITALLFNPLIPVHLSRDTWAVIDLAAAALMVVSLFTVRTPKEGRKDNVKNLPG